MQGCSLASVSFRNRHRSFESTLLTQYSTVGVMGRDYRPISIKTRVLESTEFHYRYAIEHRAAGKKRPDQTASTEIVLLILLVRLHVPSRFRAAARVVHNRPRVVGLVLAVVVAETALRLALGVVEPLAVVL